ncbi:HipA-like C-terminal domain protein [Aeromicrobium marinum DSM 15272]|uniref:HipA-like C-terminal domain protein n=1 Tax=Aeromicrobium marinum DSM 15272 TaxID=585531 RepID=E2S851_9ACTN|nr:type II toxin-antitoxin system HipA family toxin [Aeromicrobium marinum]EFQ84356.1 HipA-like C-terminal domain protein [Aeromicrobium marinum DSM 15272]
MVYQPVEVLRVQAWGKPVGAVAADPRSGAYVFEYEPSWTRARVELAPSLMPTTNRSRIFTFPALSAETFRRLPPMLADSIPDGFGNAIIDAYLAREGVARDAVTALDRLAYVGDRGMGALTFHPDTGRGAADPTAVVMADLVVAARAAIEGNLQGHQHTDVLNRLLTVGTSAGGARAKAVIAWDRSTGDMLAGNIAVPDRFERWLVKFDGVGADPQLGDSQQYGRIEYAYSLMARAAGIDMAETFLLQEGGRAHFMTKRFDRAPDGTRTHMQSLCALGALDFNQQATHDYASYLLMCDNLGLGPAAREQAFRRMVFNIAASNCDDHTKNFSFLMDPDGTWRLAPAYDITYAFNPDNQWLRQHLMSVGGKFTDIKRADLNRFGDQFEVPRYEQVTDQVLDAIANWPAYAHKAGVTKPHIRTIGRRIADVRPA